MTRLLLILLCVPAALPAQDSILNRVILIGDAGEISGRQQSILKDAAHHVLSGKTTVLFLGDNIYRKGMALPGSPQRAETESILASQFVPMRAAGAAVYFVPGNHDWDNSGPLGLVKIKEQWKFLEASRDSLLRVIPPNGCPDPVLINVSSTLAIIGFDSEWWLYPFTKLDAAAGCACKNKDEVVARLQYLIAESRQMAVILADHHPFQSYGPHGGYFSWKDHLFPLTALNKHLWLPMPVLGSLYPLLRRSLLKPEDLRHPRYREMIRAIDGPFEGHTNIIHASGHEHGLQLINSENGLQVVSGSGAKRNHVKKGRNALFASSKGGFVLADILPDSSLRITFYTKKDNATASTSSFVHNRLPLQVLHQPGKRFISDHLRPAHL